MRTPPSTNKCTWLWELWLYLFWLLLVLLPWLLPDPGSGGWLDELKPPPAVEAAFEGVFTIEVALQYSKNYPGRQDEMEPGVGFLVRPDLLVTASHIFSPTKGGHFFFPPPDSVPVSIQPGKGILIYNSPHADIALFRLTERLSYPVLLLRQTPPLKQELIWWICRLGLLANEWSVGRFLDEVPPLGALRESYAHPVYFVNPILGGLHAGCSGSPAFDKEGRVIGIISSYLSSGNLLNALIVRSVDILEVLIR